MACLMVMAWGCGQSPETLPDSMTRQDEIAQQLAILNEQLAGQAVRRRQHRRWAVLCLPLALLAAVFLYMGGVLLYRSLTETPPVPIQAPIYMLCGLSTMMSMLLVKVPELYFPT